PPCVNASSTVTIAEVAPPNAGTDGALTLCISSPAASLFAALGGAQAGGTWSGPSPVVGGMFDPANMTAGVYTYTLNGTAPCPNDQSIVTVTVVTNPDPGTNGSITVCESGSTIGLFAQLGGTPDPGGSWTGPSVVAGDVFDPATMNAGVYTYTITVPPPCTSASSTATVTISQPADAGDDGALTLCISSPVTALINSLGGTPQAGGTWSGPSAVVGGMFDPATMNAGVYTYTVNGTAPCPADAASVTVTVVTEPDPGINGTITACSTGASFSLIAQLGGTPDAGGSWTGPSVVIGDVFDPATMNAGGYTYTINVPPPCASVSSTVTVNVNAPPDAGSDGNITLCSSDAAVDLFNSLGGSPDTGGTWSGPSVMVGGSFDPATMNAGAYMYTAVGEAPCPADVALVIVALVQPPNPGADDILNLCIVGTPVDLFPVLGGADAGGTWSGPGGA
ncbi:MAG TPA: hypothetical protein PK760_13100, partial [Flavobacteriales bacterium]|nr:hypothetical protein [Flavobacteriales bacterium]